ncbi:MAG: hypothetical protein AseanaTS_00450 [Candidatus Pelagadaptatus aseana]
MAAVVALAAGIVIGRMLPGDGNPDAEQQNQPLYWVAPMDPDYRRDGPGKSPMGMDLVPVYAESASIEPAPGVIRISPDVVNNLGVRVAPVRLDVLRPQIKTVGYVKYDEDQLVHIHPRVEGWVERLYVKAAGDPVKQGQPLYDLYSPELVNAQEEYVLALERNNNTLVRATENRLRALHMSDDFIRTLKRQRQVRQAITFISAQDGVVDNLNIREGYYVKPGTTMMSIGRLDQVWVEAEVFERQAALVRAGLPVTMSLNYLQGEPWQGEVDYVYPTLDPQTRTLRVRLRFDNPERLLKPNMFAEVRIFTDSDTPQLLVPKQAVIRTGSRDVVVLALGEGRFKSVAVVLGDADDDHVAIDQGVASTDKVVVSAQFLLDSESSRDSDFKRMHHPEPSDPPMDHSMHHHH